MENKLTKKYGLFTAIAMVVGIVIGSGVFFKAEKILNATGGDVFLGIVAWLIGGAIMVSCGYVFAVLAAKYENVNGIVDYAEAAYGKKYAYGVGWFMAVVYYPTLTSVLSWVSARYTCVVLGIENPVSGTEVYVIAAFYMIAMFTLNALSPVLAGKFQVSTTIIKLIPLSLIAVIGLISGLATGQTIENFTAVSSAAAVTSPLLTSVVATAFAYEGWIVATSINAELKDAKTNLPKALLIGTAIIVAVYILYYIGITGALPTSEIMAGAESGVKLAFTKLLGNLGGSTLFVFIVISCLGTLNGLTLGCARGIYALAARDLGPAPKVFKQIDSQTNTPISSAFLGLLFTMSWLVVWYGNFAGWWSIFLDTSELPIITMYAIYIPIFLWMIKNLTELSTFKRIVMPTVAIAGSVFMICAAYISHGKQAVLTYLVIFAVITAIGFMFYSSKPVKQQKKKS